MDELDFRDAYAPPRGELAKPPDQAMPDLRFLARWERRRVAYNGALAGVVLVLTGLDAWGPLLDPGFWEFLIVAAFGANVCFCTGPVAEAYLRWVGVRRQWLGDALFGAGLVLSAPLAAVCVWAFLLAKAGF